jgi:hypothetical protein
MQDERGAGNGFSHKISLKGRIGMLEIADPHDDSGKMSLEGIRAFLAVSEPVVFAGQSREETYRWVEEARASFVGSPKRSSTCQIARDRTPDPV